MKRYRAKLLKRETFINEYTAEFSAEDEHFAVEFAEMLLKTNDPRLNYVGGSYLPSFTVEVEEIADGGQNGG